MFFSLNELTDTCLFLTFPNHVFDYDKSTYEQSVCTKYLYFAKLPNSIPKNFMIIVMTDTCVASSHDDTHCQCYPRIVTRTIMAL